MAHTPSFSNFAHQRRKARNLVVLVHREENLLRAAGPAHLSNEILKIVEQVLLHRIFRAEVEAWVVDPRFEFVGIDGIDCLFDGRDIVKSAFEFDWSEHIDFLIA